MRCTHCGHAMRDHWLTNGCKIAGCACRQSSASGPPQPTLFAINALKGDAYHQHFDEPDDGQSW